MLPTIKAVVWTICFGLAAKICEAACPTAGQNVTFQGPCTFANIEAELLANEACNISTIQELTEELVQELCDSAAIAFGDISNNYYQFDNNFMDGGSRWNNDEEVDVSMALDASRLSRFKDNRPFHRIAWPTYEALEEYSKLGNETNEPYMSNFNLTESCDLRTVMCCFIGNRDLTKPLEGNAKVCHHDMRSSRRSNHVARGFAIYNETDAYCTAFAWDGDETSESFRYKGNLLYDISFGSFLDKGFVKNIPGGPMCACIEKMPTVTKATCRSLAVTNEEYSINVDQENVPSITQIGGYVEFNDCGDFAQNYRESGIASETEAEEMESNHFVTSCADSTEDFLNTKFLVPGNTNQWERKTAGGVWEQFAGMGLSYYPVKTNNITELDEDFREKFDASPEPKIVYRHCPGCLETHQHIYYRRISTVPDKSTGFNFLNLFLSDWTSEFNEMGTDFNLYSTYADAASATNAWAKCNFDQNGVGFPRECGPTAQTPCQWNTYKDKSICGDNEYTAITHAFYLRKQID